MDNEEIWEVASNKSNASILEERLKRKRIKKLQNEAKDKDSQIEALKASLEYHKGLLKRYKEGITDKLMIIHDLRYSIRELKDDLKVKETFIENSIKTVKNIPKILTFDINSNEVVICSKDIKMKATLTFETKSITDKCYLCLLGVNDAAKFSCGHFVCGECYLSNWDTLSFVKCGICRKDI